MSSIDPNKGLGLSPVSGSYEKPDIKEKSLTAKKIADVAIKAMFTLGAIALIVGMAFLINGASEHTFSLLGLSLAGGGIGVGVAAFAIHDKFFPRPEKKGNEGEVDRSDFKPWDINPYFAACQLL